jgi:hypothetical protein
MRDGILEVNVKEIVALSNKPLQLPTPEKGARSSRGSAFRVRASCANIAFRRRS